MGKITSTINLFLIVESLGALGCSGVVSTDGSSAGLGVCSRAASSSSASGGVDSSGSNVLSVTVGSGALCGTQSNFLCTSVTVCPVGSSSGCQTLPDILVDTGSYGLRIFVQALNPLLCATLSTLSAAPGNSVAECATFGSLTTWGSVMVANVQLAGEPPVKASIQVMDKAFATVPASCGQVATSPRASGFNGILGVGLKQGDCGSSCESSATNNMYYTCTSAGVCTSTSISVASQVTNPVGLLPVDNNGVLLDLPSVGAAGTTSVTGSLYLGIGTRTNNTKASETVYAANSKGYFQTAVFSQTYVNSFIDSGTNTFNFSTNSGLALCTGAFSSFYCPVGAPLSFTATTTGLPSGNSGTVSFSVGNVLGGASTNKVFNNLASTLSSGFDDNTLIWGLPFFLGRRVFVGIEGKTSPFGLGPYWAY